MHVCLRDNGQQAPGFCLSLPPQHWDYTRVPCCLDFLMKVLAIKCGSSSLQSKHFLNPPFYFLIRKCIFLLCPWVLLRVELYPSKRYVEALNCRRLWMSPHLETRAFEKRNQIQVKSWEATLIHCDQCSCVKWERRQLQTKEQQELATRWQKAGMAEEGPQRKPSSSTSPPLL